MNSQNETNFLCCARTGLVAKLVAPNFPAPLEWLNSSGRRQTVAYDVSRVVLTFVNSTRPEEKAVPVEIRIGIVNVARELTLDVDDNDAEKLKSESESALSGSTNMLWVTDRDGREVGISVAQLAYIEFGAAGDRRIGFATD